MKRFEVMRDGQGTGVERKTKAAAVSYATSFVRTHPEHVWTVFDRKTRTTINVEGDEDAQGGNNVST